MWSGFGPLGGPGSPRPVAPVLATDQTEARPVFSSGSSNIEESLLQLDDETSETGTLTGTRAEDGPPLIDFEASSSLKEAPSDEAKVVETDDVASDLNSESQYKINASDSAPASQEPEEIDPKDPEPKQSASKLSEPKESKPKESKPKHSDAKQSEPKQPEPKQPEPEQSEAKQTKPSSESKTRKPKNPNELETKQPEPVELEPEANESAGNVDTDLDHDLPHELERRVTSDSAGEGSLRRSSIAAMRELGEPQTTAEEEQVPFDFQAFLDLIRAKQADPIVRYVKSFLQEFAKKAWTPEQQEKIVADFHKFITLKMKQFEPFKSLGPVQSRNAGEGMEKLVMNRLYVRTFPPVMPPVLRRDGHDEDLLKDQVLQEKLRLWGWVQGRHLDINVEYLQPQFLKLACAELSRIHQFRAPRDKMICILNCCKVVWALIRQAHLEQNADSFLPLLIYVVLKAQPQHLVSNINYIQRFRAAEYRAGETMYYLSALASAVAFVEGLDKSSLTITDQEFEEEMTKAAAAERERLEELRVKAETKEPRRSESRNSEEDEFGMESVLAASAGMLVDRMKTLTSHFFDDNPDIDTHSPAPGQSAQPANPQEARQRERRLRSRETAEEQAAREASAEEYEAQQLREQEFNQILDTLEKMFPVLDKEVLEDVLREKNTNVGAAVDVCLALVGSS